MPYLKPGDIVFVASDGLVAWLIRRFRSRDGKATYVNHVALVVEEGSLSTAVLMDAQPPMVQRRRLGEYAGQLVAVYRPVSIPPLVMDRIVYRAQYYEGKRYGITKIVLHMLGLAGLARVDGMPICSWTVAVPFSREGYSFGVDSGIARPDHVWDWCSTHADQYKRMKALGILEG